MEDGVSCLAEFAFNQNKLTRITSLARGVVKSVEVDLGSRVQKGDLLATLTSATIGEAQGAYLRAMAEHELRETVLERQRSLLAQRISSEKDYQEAEAAHHVSTTAVRQAHQWLLVLGFDEVQIQALTRQQSTPGVLELRAPFEGEIVERTAVQGAVVEEADVLFTLTDTAVLWATVNIPRIASVARQRGAVGGAHCRVATGPQLQRNADVGLADRWTSEPAWCRGGSKSRTLPDT